MKIWDRTHKFIITKMLHQLLNNIVKEKRNGRLRLEKLVARLE